ncbi:MAG: hypothetical protein RL705_229 [Bacteroidota bacterium]|jgi:hypothetical protein
MKLTLENVAVIDKILLKKYGLIYRDIRLELLDHLVSELELMEGSFEEKISEFMDSEKDFIQKTNTLLTQQYSKNGLQQVAKAVFSLKFILLYVMTTLVFSYLVSVNGKDWFLTYFDILPIVIPAPLSLIELYSLCTSNRRLYTFSLVGSFNMIFMIYLFLFIHLVRKAEDLYAIAVFSFFMTLSLTYYYSYWVAVKQHTKKLI